MKAERKMRNPSEEAVLLIRRQVLESLENISEHKADYEDLVRKTARHFLRQEMGRLRACNPELSFSYMFKLILNDLLGLGCLEPLIEDKKTTDVLVEDTNVFVVNEDERKPAAMNFSDINEVRRIIDRITGSVGKRVDAAMPYCDCHLYDGSRCHIVIPPVSDRIYITIRKHGCSDITINDWVNSGIMTRSIGDMLSTAVEAKMNIVISGGTGAGKTTLLNSLAKLIKDDQIIVTIEDTYELKLDKPHVRRLLTREKSIEGTGQITFSTLIKNGLRMNPDRLIIGEVRDHVAYDLLHALNIGHKGSISTIHANSVVDGLWRLETLAMQASLNLSLTAIRRQIARVVDIVIQLRGVELIDGAYADRQVIEVARIGPELIGNDQYDIELLM
jgi:pilus assembly protein CpaF